MAWMAKVYVLFAEEILNATCMNAGRQAEQVTMQIILLWKLDFVFVLPRLERARRRFQPLTQSTKQTHHDTELT